VHRGRWFLLGVGVGVVGARRMAMVIRPALERPLEHSAQRALKRVRSDVKVAVREGIAVYRGTWNPGRVVEGEVQQVDGF
jgi:hypothetical protein